MKYIFSRRDSKIKFKTEYTQIILYNHKTGDVPLVASLFFANTVVIKYIYVYIKLVIFLRYTDITKPGKIWETILSGKILFFDMDRKKRILLHWTTRYVRGLT